MLRKVVDFANVTVSLATGAYLFLLLTLRFEWLKALPAGMIASGLWWLFLLAAAGLLFANIYLLVIEYRIKGFRDNLRISTEQGKIELSVAALEMQLLRDLRNEPDVSEPVVRLEPHGEGKPMLCEVSLKLRRQDDVISRMDSLKRMVSDNIYRLIPSGLTVEIRVEIKGFVTDNPRVSRRERAPAEPGEFNGPVYSDGGGSEGV